MNNVGELHIFCVKKEDVMKALSDILSKKDSTKKSKDTQLSINFYKEEKFAELKKSTKDNLIDIIRKLDEENTRLKQENEDLVNAADKKIEKLIAERDDILNKFSKQSSYVEYLKAKLNECDVTLNSIAKALNFIK